MQQNVFAGAEPELQHVFGSQFVVSSSVDALVIEECAVGALEVNDVRSDTGKNTEQTAHSTYVSERSNTGTKTAGDITYT